MKRRKFRGLICALAGAVSVLSAQADPYWWRESGVLVSNQAADDYFAFNVGQLKNMASNAYVELETAMQNGGAGVQISNLVHSFANDNNYDIANIGQLKAVAYPFHSRLNEVGYSTNYPWTAATNDDADYAAANIGQLKNVFSFDLGMDIDGDGMPNRWEVRNGLNPFSGLTNTLAAWWRLDEYGGTNVLNSATNLNHGYLAGFSDTNASGWRLKGIPHGALQFNGENDRVEVFQYPVIATGGAFTVSALARLDAGSTQAFPKILSNSRIISGSNSVGYSIGFNATSVYAQIDETILSIYRDNQSYSNQDMMGAYDEQPMMLDSMATVGTIDAFSYHGRTTIHIEVWGLWGTIGFDLERLIDGAWVKINDQRMDVPMFQDWMIMDVVDPAARLGETYKWRLVAYDMELNPTYDGPHSILVDQLSYSDWKESHFTYEERADLVVSGTSADPDGDGWTNLEEYLYGTDPRQEDPLGPWVWVAMEYQAGQMRLYCNGELAGSATNVTFTSAGTNLLVIGDGQNPAQSAQWMGLIDDVRIYRTALGSNGVAAIYDAWKDLDGDDLVNLLECLMGTSPGDSDSDDDGMPDGWEVGYDLTPNDSGDADDDPDADGVSNLQEYIEGTSPREGDDTSPSVQILVPTNGSWRVWVP